MSKKNDLKELESVVKETYNCEFRINFNGKAWTLYLVKSRTHFIGTFENVIEASILEIKGNRTESNTTKKKNYKKFTYK